MANDLVIKISGDVSSFQDSLEKIQKKTEGLNKGFESLSLAAGVVFAAMTAEIFESAKAFGQGEEATNALTNAMQNQGIYSDDLISKYKEYAEAIQKKTGIDNDQIVQAEATTQSMIGQTKISEELITAITDLSVAKKMDLNSTAELISKGIDGHTTALKKLGIEIDEGLTKQQRMDAIVEQVSLHFGDAAEQANKGMGSVKGLSSSFEDMQKGLGERFAPAIEAVIDAFTRVFQYISNNQPLLDLIASVTIAATVVSGLALALGVGGMAYLKLTAIMEAYTAATDVANLSTKLLVGATGLGALIFIGTEIYMNWSSLWPKVQSMYQGFVTFVSNLSSGLGEMLQGVFQLDTNKISEGFKHVKDTVSKGMTAAVSVVSDGVTGMKDYISSLTSLPEVQVPKIKHQDQDPFKLAAARKDSAERVAIEIWTQQQLALQKQLILEKEDGASQEIIDIHTKESSLLKEIEDSKNKSIRSSLMEHLATYKELEAAADEDSLEQESEFDNEILAKNQQFQQMSAQQQQMFLATQGNKLKQSMQTEEMAKQQFAVKKAQEQVADNNAFLANQEEFGTAVATIDQFMHSKVMSNTKDAMSQMVSMQNSHNEVLKTIGKASAIMQIVFATEQAAMNVFNGLSIIPVVGFELGIAAAAAVIAYGAEQIGQVAAMAEGGLVTGGIPGKDSVPTMLMPGELVVPKQNFQEVVTSVANQNGGGGGPSGSGGDMSATIELSLKDGLMDFIEAKLVKRKRMKLAVQGLF